MPERRLGEITPQQALKCREIDCKLLQDKPYPMCAVLLQIRQDVIGRGARNRAAKDYHQQIRKDCPRGYDEVQPARHARF